MAQNIGFSTHDFTISPQPPIYAEGWVDVKMPGGFPFSATTPDSRRTYVVGTIEVQTTQPGAMFSNAPASPDGLPPFGPGPVRQVVMLQCNGTTAAGSGVQQWQRFFYGVPLPAGALQATNARAVAVWEAIDPLDTRVAICGEAYDDTLPLSQSATGWTLAGPQGSTGFIAVYRGDGVLLWTHHFFSNNPGLATDTCAITDLAIRVDAEGNEIVTYCGIFTHGDPGAGSELTPLLPFAAPPPTALDVEVMR